MSTPNDVITNNLSELLTNTVNMTSVYYDLFINPEPMDVTLQQYDSTNTLVTVTVPNRAKDKQVALTGTGSPEGVVVAPVGKAFVDLADSTVYIKSQGDGNTGWFAVLTQAGVESYLRNYLNDNKFLTEDTAKRYLTNQGYIDKQGLGEALLDYKPTIRMSTLPSTGSISLESNAGYVLNPTGNVTIVLPEVTDLTMLHKIFIQVKIDADVTINVGTTSFFDQTPPDFTDHGMYNLIYEYDNASHVWVCGSMYKGIV